VQVLLFQVGNQRYAIDACVVTEVIPAVPLRPVPGTAAPVAGLLDYRGHVVPVVDLCRLFGEGSCPSLMSSRIAVCDLVVAGAVATDVPDAERWAGVLAERLTRVGDVDPDASGTHPGPRTPEVPALGRVLRDEEGLLQLVTVSQLIPADVLSSLAAGNDEASP
jgi:chemotaxis-related protein WspB